MWQVSGAVGGVLQSHCKKSAAGAEVTRHQHRTRGRQEFSILHTQHCCASSRVYSSKEGQQACLPKALCSEPCLLTARACTPPRSQENGDHFLGWKGPDIQASNLQLFIFKNGLSHTGPLQGLPVTRKRFFGDTHYTVPKSSTARDVLFLTGPGHMCPSAVF